MHRCGSSMGNSSYGAAMPCSCPGASVYQAGGGGGGGGGTSAFTILFDAKPPTTTTDTDYYYQYASSDATTDPSYTYYSSSGSSCSSPVDCTLSLGTASTRHNGRRAASPPRATNTSCLPGFYWDIFGSSSKNTAPPPPHHTAANARPTAAAAVNGGCSNSFNSNADPLLARRCANCDTTSTPLWRNGPRGPKSLCNACGIRYKKEERRAAATAASTADHAAAAAVAAATQGPAHHQQSGYGAPTYNYDGANPWSFTSANNAVAKQSKSPSSISISSSSGDYLFHGGHDGSSSNSDNSDTGLPNYLSWCLNVPAQLPRAEYLHHY